MEKQAMWIAGAAALLMAGGRSSRMRASGCDTHKGLRTVLGAPLLAWNLASLLSFGCRSIYVAYSVQEPDLATWVETAGPELAQSAGAQLTPLVERCPLGTIGALSLLPEEVPHTVVVNADNLSDLSLSTLLRHHVASSAPATVAVHRQPFRMPFGRVAVASGQVLQYDEKPEILVPVCSGVSAFSRRAIPFVSPGAVMHLPDLVSRLLAAGETVSAFEHESRWIDINEQAALCEAETLISAGGPDWPGQPLLRLAHV